jgi:hypothetical protein
LITGPIRDTIFYILVGVALGFILGRLRFWNYTYPQEKQQYFNIDCILDNLYDLEDA